MPQKSDGKSSGSPPSRKGRQSVPHATSTSAGSMVQGGSSERSAATADITMTQTAKASSR